jgi:hypothetical protein
MISWKDMMKSNQAPMDGDWEGHRVWIRKIEELRRTPRTGITFEFKKSLTLGLYIKAQSSVRGQAHWWWGVLAGVFFCAGIGGAIVAWNPGPLVACLGGGLILWGWLAARKTLANQKAGAISSGDQRLDDMVQVEAEDSDRMLKCLQNPRVRELLTELVTGDKEITMTDQKISLNINSEFTTDAEFEKELSVMGELFEALVDQDTD